MLRRGLFSKSSAEMLDQVVLKQNHTKNLGLEVKRPKLLELLSHSLNEYSYQYPLRRKCSFKRIQQRIQTGL